MKLFKFYQKYKQNYKQLLKAKVILETKKNELLNLQRCDLDHDKQKQLLHECNGISEILNESKIDPNNLARTLRVYPRYVK
jgi:hypothetical protein